MPATFHNIYWFVYACSCCVVGSTLSTKLVVEEEEDKSNWYLNLQATSAIANSFCCPLQRVHDNDHGTACNMASCPASEL